ncbi:MAG: hypothetical protein Q9181_005439 [Wetmoreana brouardii]
MSSGASGSDEKISAAKIDPLASDVKANVPHDQSSRGAVGSDRNIDQARIEPVGGGATLSILTPLSAIQTHLHSSIPQLSRNPKNLPQTKKTKPFCTDHFKHPAPHTDAGVIGPDANIDKSKIEPLQGQTSKGGVQQPSGLGDEEIDAARVKPLGEVREEM